MHKFTEEEELNLVKDYQEGMTWDNLCVKYSTNLHTVHKKLKKYNVSKNHIKTWSKEKQDLFTRMYLSNATYQEMYNALDCKGGTLTYWVHKLNLPMRGSGRNNIYPNKFLENTPESYYWLGYIFADGHIQYGKRNNIVSLVSKEKYVIDKYCAWYNNLPSINTRDYTLNSGEVHTMYNAYLCSIELASYFHNTLGINNKKHHTLNPNIEINWDIIRGFFDGDGCSSKNVFSIASCSLIWLTRIKEFMEKQDIRPTISKHYKDCYSLTVYKKGNLSKLVNLMYQNKYYCHEYKFKNLEQFLSN